MASVYSASFCLPHRTCHLSILLAIYLDFHNCSWSRCRQGAPVLRRLLLPRDSPGALPRAPGLATALPPNYPPRRPPHACLRTGAMTAKAAVPRVGGPVATASPEHPSPASQRATLPHWRTSQTTPRSSSWSKTIRSIKRYMSLVQRRQRCASGRLFSFLFPVHSSPVRTAHLSCAHAPTSNNTDAHTHPNPPTRLHSCGPKVATGFVRKCNLQPVSAWDGNEAIALCEKRRFDLILMDLQVRSLFSVHSVDKSPLMLDEQRADRIQGQDRFSRVRVVHTGTRVEARRSE